MQKYATPFGEIIENGEDVQFIKSKNVAFFDAQQSPLLSKYDFLQQSYSNLQIQLSQDLNLLWIRCNGVNAFLLYRDTDTILSTFQENVDSNYDLSLINFEGNYYILSKSHQTLLITETEIKPINLTAMSSSGKPIPPERIYCNSKFSSRNHDNENIPIIIPQQFDGKYYITNDHHLFLFVPKSDELIIQHIDESAEYFGFTTISLPTKGLLSINRPSNMMFPHNSDADLEFTLYNPNTHELFHGITNIAIKSEVYCISIISNDRIAIVFKEAIVEQHQHYHVISGYNYKLGKIINVNDIQFELSNQYKYKPPLELNYVQYIPKYPEAFDMKKEENKYDMYLPAKPYCNYKVVKGFGKVPKEFKSKDYKEVDEIEILTKIGAPIFYKSQNTRFVTTNENNVIHAAMINLPDNMSDLSSLRLSSSHHSGSCLRKDELLWLGIVEAIDKDKRKNVDEIPVTKWKKEIPRDYNEVDVVDGETIFGIDPGDLWATEEKSPKVLNCLGGKWVAKIQYRDSVVNSLILVHKDYKKVLKEIPDENLYKKVVGNHENIERNKITPVDDMPGFEVSGLVGSDIAMSMLITQSHFFNTNDVVMAEDKEALNRFGKYVVRDGFFMANQEDQKIKQEFSILYTSLLEDRDAPLMRVVPGGAITFSGYGDGAYPLCAKRENGKAVCKQKDKVEEILPSYEELEKDSLEFEVENSPSAISQLFGNTLSHIKTLIQEADKAIADAKGIEISEEQLNEFLKTFYFFDKDKSKTLEPYELNSCLTSLGEISTEDECKEIIKKYTGLR
ncbi:putative alpha-actinin [Histomonas meleagridis]|uniref:putative alpha-actinin n=1 Tax=Histomonas meleagridis TaxID=135588 RepID=UPI0035598FDA|nr:putative alpha-actinin [Histomonas meleagridis]KAH0801543.1 putative alpha-actinin [Histomonas meleagridis]